jgi:hypothetical protein
MPPVMYEDPVVNTDAMSNEQYLIYQAKLALKQGDPYASKSWMITARTMFPDNFSVQVRVPILSHYLFKPRLEQHDVGQGT